MRSYANSTNTKYSLFKYDKILQKNDFVEKCGWQNVLVDFSMHITETFSRLDGVEVKHRIATKTRI